MSTADLDFMRIAVSEAEIAAKYGNYPVGAVLTADGKLIGQAHNMKESKRNRISHAEMMLFMKYSERITTIKSSATKSRLELYTTFEPCLMCFGTCVIHRIDRIIVACRDPRGDLRSLHPEKLGSWYERYWPKIEYGLMYKESYALLNHFFNSRTDVDGLEAANLFARIEEEKLGD